MWFVDINGPSNPTPILGQVYLCKMVYWSYDLTTKIYVGSPKFLMLVVQLRGIVEFESKWSTINLVVVKKMLMLLAVDITGLKILSVLVHLVQGSGKLLTDNNGIFTISDYEFVSLTAPQSTIQFGEVFLEAIGMNFRKSYNDKGSIFKAPGFMGVIIKI